MQATFRSFGCQRAEQTKSYGTQHTTMPIRNLEQHRRSPSKTLIYLCTRDFSEAANQQLLCFSHRFWGLSLTDHSYHTIGAFTLAKKSTSRVQLLARDDATDTAA